MKKEIVSRFLNKEVGVSVSEDGQHIYKRGIIIIISDDCFILKFPDERENVILYNRVTEIREL